jgi:hypothetical protein
MPRLAADELRQLAADNGLAFKHLTSVCLSIGLAHLRPHLVAAAAAQQEVTW